MIQGLIDKYIADSRDLDRKPSGKFSCGDAGRCHLMRYWKRQGKTPTDTPDERTLRVFEVGHIFHKWVQEIMEKQGLLAAKEFKVEDEHRIGYIDVIGHIPDIGTVIWDIKTVHSKKFHWMDSEGNGGDSHHKAQILTYKMLYPLPVAQTRLVYLSKDDLCIREYGIVETDELKHTINDDWNILIACWRAQTEPVPNPVSWECKYCMYFSGCEQKPKVESKPKKLSEKEALK